MSLCGPVNGQNRKTSPHVSPLFSLRRPLFRPIEDAARSSGILDDTARMEVSVQRPCWLSCRASEIADKRHLRSVGETAKMIWDASSPDGTYLTLSADQDWHIRIWRADNQPDERFRHYNGKTMTNGNLKHFVPHWDSLEWEPRRKDAGPSEMIRASDGDLRIALVTLVTKEGCALTEGQIVEEFRWCMVERE